MKKIIIILLVLVLIVVGVLGYLGIIPGVAKIFGSDKPRDLGIKFTADNYKTADTKAQVKIETMASAMTVKDGLVVSGKKDVINSFSSEELTAVLNTHSSNWKYYLITDAQIKIDTDGSVAFSGLLNFDRFAGYSEATGINYTEIKSVMDKFKIAPGVLAVYVDGTPTVKSGKVNLVVNKAEFGRMSIPGSLITKNQGVINDFFSQQINMLPGFYIESLDFENGNMNFKGTMPEKIITAIN
ncbi:MAG: hypothetical protein NTW73_00755 [Candidatus Parcubacteria bacterium]|nr:hypothetical protein [Candidatus Parcubacteria bacterium]